MKEHAVRLGGNVMDAWRWLTAKPWRLAAVVTGMVLVAGGVVGLTDLKYTLLGGIAKGAVKVTVTDAATKLPVPKALVESAGRGELTDKAGRVTLGGLHAGHQTLLVRKIGYSDYSQPLTVGLGGNVSVQVALKPNGIALDASVSNVITGAAIEGVEVHAGDAEALTDKDGHAKLSLPPASDNTKVTVEFTKDGYNSAQAETLVREGAAPLHSALTPAGKVYFLSNRSNKIDLYESNLDGTQTAVVLAGTGNEDAATGILPNITNHQFLALDSSREGRRQDGQLVHDLFLFDTGSKQLTKIDENVSFGNFRAWLGDTLVYERTKNDPNLGNCNDLKTYNLQTRKAATFFSSNGTATGCPRITVALADSVFYTVSNVSDKSKEGFYQATATSAGKKVSDRPSNTTIRKVHDTVLSEYYNYSDNSTLWDSINLGTMAVTQLPNGPSDETSRYYNDSPSGNYSSFVEERDGKSELYLTDGGGGNEHKLTSLGSVNQFVQWYGDEYIVFSSTKTEENALYVVATSGGAPVKVADFYRGNQKTYGGGGNAYY
jgi:hypothetical protein